MLTEEPMNGVRKEARVATRSTASRMESLSFPAVMRYYTLTLDLDLASAEDGVRRISDSAAVNGVLGLASPEAGQPRDEFLPFTAFPHDQYRSSHKDGAISAGYKTYE